MQFQTHSVQNAQVETWSLEDTEFKPRTFAYNNAVDGDIVRLSFEGHDDHAYNVDMSKEDMKKQLEINYSSFIDMPFYTITYKGKTQWTASITCDIPQNECFKKFFIRDGEMTIDKKLPKVKRSPPKKRVSVPVNVPVPVQPATEVSQQTEEKQSEAAPSINLRRIIRKYMKASKITERYSVQEGIYNISNTGKITKVEVSGKGISRKQWENVFVSVRFNQVGNYDEDYEKFQCKIKIFNHKGRSEETIRVSRENIRSLTFGDSFIKFTEGETMTSSVVTMHLNLDDVSAKDIFEAQKKLFEKKKDMMLEYLSKCGPRRRLQSLQKLCCSEL